MKTTQDRINDLWNDLVTEVYDEWKSSQMRNDDFLKLLGSAELDAELISELRHVYIEYCFDYDTFLDSEENQALLSITNSGASKQCASCREAV